MTSTPSNELAAAASLYLRQHANNPIHWAQWGPKAHERARLADLPIFVSIGYSACHWCHVMERESFDDPQVANRINHCFVPIKVDREERPDVDSLYMACAQAMGVPGGWPLNLWLTPELAPLYAATYVPRHSRGSMVGILDLCASISDQWTRQRERSRGYARDNLDLVHRRTPPPLSKAPPTGPSWAAAISDLEGAFDRYNGGFGYGQKFAQPPTLRLLLEAHQRLSPALSPAVRDLGNRARDMLTLTLRGVDRGGVHDHVGGGFHRYAVDPEWEVPHFEKMLTDQAQLAELFAECARAGLGQRFAELADECCRHMTADYTIPGGPLLGSSFDADTAGEEGPTYRWTRDEIEGALLGAGSDPGVFFSHVRVHSEGTLLRLDDDVDAIHNALGVLRQRRANRAQPPRDDGRHVFGNALAASAFARTGLVTGQERWFAVAAEIIHTLLRLIAPDGRLPRHAAEGAPQAVLADHAALLRACLDVHEVTGDPTLLEGAARVGRRIIDAFQQPDGGLYGQAEDCEDLPVRRPEWGEGDAPDANALAAEGLLRLANAMAPGFDAEPVRGILRAGGAILERAPAGVPTLLRVAEALAEGPRVLVVGGRRDNPETLVFLREAARTRSPGEAILLADGAPSWPIFEGKAGDGPPRAWPCRGTWCDQPIDDLGALARRNG